MGIAMSITAFPVLARIIQEKNLTRTKLGSLALTCAAADDVTAWCILAVVIATVKAGSFIKCFFYDRAVARLCVNDDVCDQTPAQEIRQALCKNRKREDGRCWQLFLC